ncbi:TetR family transcriptional regulator [Streptomyces sp. NPDC051940]|uniref:TetR/AcrR family transcriptional regulator n=1 Tax=Streptomyces sp. NPDC051940 TaxID=3155675 RepID=UPI003418119E
MAASLPASHAHLGLRERKKIRTRQAIRAAAYRLMGEQGYDATTVEQIAEAAEVSPSTVFRYFPTKEDIVLSDEYDPMLVEAIRSRPADEPPLTALRRGVLESLGALREEVDDELAARLGLIRSVPALRARLHESMGESAVVLCGALGERTGRPADDFELRVVAGAVLGALTQALLDWIEDEGAGDLVETVDRALLVLERGLVL